MKKGYSTSPYHPCRLMFWTFKKIRIYFFHSLSLYLVFELDEKFQEMRAFNLLIFIFPFLCYVVHCSLVFCLAKVTETETEG